MTLDDIAKRMNRRALDSTPPIDIIHAACDLYGVDMSEVLGPVRRTRTTLVRRIAGWVLYQKSISSYPWLAVQFNRQPSSHSSAIWWVRGWKAHGSVDDTIELLRRLEIY
jgi:chromosomal replication initiation ATPase DnaA